MADRSGFQPQSEAAPFEAVEYSHCMSLHNEATHPRCSVEGCPDRPGRASYKEGESWGMIAKLSEPRDGLNLAKLLRAGELTAVWVPDDRDEAMRDLSRAAWLRIRIPGASASRSSR
jgi:hypothetical protein